MDVAEGVYCSPKVMTIVDKWVCGAPIMTSDSQIYDAVANGRSNKEHQHTVFSLAQAVRCFVNV